MNLFLKYVFLFYIGSTFGWVLELFFRRLAHGKWVNPGFLVGPYLPIYGFGLCTLTFLYTIFSGHPAYQVILLMGVSMTIIEFIGGLCFLRDGVKLWDYSENWGNYKGIICPLFSFIWLMASAIYYFFIAKYMIEAIDWFNNNLSFSFVVGVFFGIITLDFIYSEKVLYKIKKFAIDNDIEVRYEELKLHISELQRKRKEKYSFIFAFKQNNPLKEYLEEYKKLIRKRK